MASTLSVNFTSFPLTGFTTLKKRNMIEEFEFEGTLYTAEFTADGLFLGDMATNKFSIWPSNGRFSLNPIDGYDKIAVYVEIEGYVVRQDVKFPADLLDKLRNLIKVQQVMDS